MFMHANFCRDICMSPPGGGLLLAAAASASDSIAPATALLCSATQWNNDSCEEHKQHACFKAREATVATFGMLWTCIRRCSADTLAQDVSPWSL